jgi:hypothetical protein
VVSACEENRILRDQKVSDQTVENILKRNGIAPSPERKKNTTWASFIRQHKEILWACDFFTTEIWTRPGLTTYYVLFFVQLSTRSQSDSVGCCPSIIGKPPDRVSYCTRHRLPL